MLLYQIDRLLRTIHVFGIAMFKPTPIKYFVVLYISHKYSFLISYAFCLMTISLQARCIMYSTLFPLPYARHPTQATLYFFIPVASLALSYFIFSTRSLLLSHSNRVTHIVAHLLHNYPFMFNIPIPILSFYCPTSIVKFPLPHSYNPISIAHFYYPDPLPRSRCAEAH